jgi:L-lactate dehydrogenase
MKVGIIGLGWVGTSVGISVLHSGVARELLLHDVRPAVAEGEAMDLAQGASFYPSATVRAVDVAEMVDCDAVVIAAGKGGAPGQSRLALLEQNATIIAGLASQLRQLRGLLVIVTNPVDVLTGIALEASGLPAARVLGTGTMLDTARLRQVLGQQFGIDGRSVHAQVVGEHGDSEVVLWSSAQLGGVSLRRWAGWSAARELEVALTVRRAAYEIIQRKGTTNHAIGLVTAALLRWALQDEQRIVTVSRWVDAADGLPGVGGVALSLPCVVGRTGVGPPIIPDMDEVEHVSLVHSAEILRASRASLSGLPSTPTIAR